MIYQVSALHIFSITISSQTSTTLHDIKCIECFHHGLSHIAIRVQGWTCLKACLKSFTHLCLNINASWIWKFDQSTLSKTTIIYLNQLSTYPGQVLITFDLKQLKVNSLQWEVVSSIDLDCWQTRCLVSFTFYIIFSTKHFMPFVPNFISASPKVFWRRFPA